MKRWPMLLLVLTLWLTGCGNDAYTQSCYIQEAAQLHPEVTLPQTNESMHEKEAGIPLNYEEVRAVWIPVMQYAGWMADGTEADFRANVRSGFAACRETGINTVYLHVRAYGDAYYASRLFPRGSHLDGDYDPLAIMLEEAHALGLSAHAWINPMRLASGGTLSGAPEEFLIRQWYDDPEKNSTWLAEADGMYYLNPAYEEVRTLIADSVTEILEQYDVDGIHIDDYFYPTQAEAFDAAAFAESGAEDLAAWRRENCNAMVRAIYDAVKAENEALLFGISPQGNLQASREKLYADAALWCSSEGYCDYIVPQIYYGFENDTCPFAETAALWAGTATEAKLILGLAAYKIGAHDKWAGSGSEEWVMDAEVLSRQIELTETLDNADGIALYSYASLFEPEEAVTAMVEAEVARIGEAWRTMQ